MPRRPHNANYLDLELLFLARDGSGPISRAAASRVADLLHAGTDLSSGLLRRPCSDRISMQASLSTNISSVIAHSGSMQLDKYNVISYTSISAEWSSLLLLLQSIRRMQPVGYDLGKYKIQGTRPTVPPISSDSRLLVGEILLFCLSVLVCAISLLCILPSRQS